MATTTVTPPYQPSVRNATMTEWSEGVTYECYQSEPSWFSLEVESIPKEAITGHECGDLVFFTTNKWPGYTGTVNARIVKVRENDDTRMIITRLSDASYEEQTKFLMPNVIKND